MEREIIGNIGGLYMCGYVSIYYKNNNRKFDIKKLSEKINHSCLLYTSPSPRDAHESSMPWSA